MTVNSIIPDQPTVPSRLQSVLDCLLMVALGALLCAATFQNYRYFQEYGFLRTNCVVAAVAAGVGIAFTFGGAMHYADLLLAADAARRPSWPLRLLLVSLKRLSLFLQVAAALLVAGALAAVLFNLPLPGPDYSMLYRGGYAPPALPGS